MRQRRSSGASTAPLVYRRAVLPVWPAGRPPCRHLFLPPEIRLQPPPCLTASNERPSAATSYASCGCGTIIKRSARRHLTTHKHAVRSQYSPRSDEPINPGSWLMSTNTLRIQHWLQEGPDSHTISDGA